MTYTHGPPDRVYLSGAAPKFHLDWKEYVAGVFVLGLVWVGVILAMVAI